MAIQMLLLILFLLGIYSLSYLPNPVLSKIIYSLLGMALILAFIGVFFVEREAAFVYVVPATFLLLMAFALFLISYINK